MATKTDSDNNNKILTRKILLGILATDFIVLIIVILFLSIRSVNVDNCYFGNAILTFLITAMACLTGGIILGFLFSIPRFNKDTEQQTTPSAEGKRPSYYKDNTNLEDISDWLTKIIVGISLVQFNAILDKIHHASEFLSKAFCCNTDALNGYYAFGYGCILFFSFSGFGIGYIWTRIVFTRMLYDNQIDIANGLSEKASPAGAELVKRNITQSENAFSETDLIAPESKASITPEAITLLQKLQNKVKDIIKTKAVYVEEDLQKGRWGGKTEDKGRRIIGIVTTSNVAGYYTILIKLENIDNSPLTIPAAVFVHDSYGFPDDAIYIKPNETDGKMQLELLGYEAFTIGVYFEDEIQLELDLNEQSGYPKDFYWGKNKKK